MSRLGSCVCGVGDNGDTVPHGEMLNVDPGEVTSTPLTAGQISAINQAGSFSGGGGLLIAGIVLFLLLRK